MFHVDLVAPTPTPEPATEGYSWLLNAVVVTVDRIVIAFGGKGTRKHESLGRLFSSLVRRDDGTFRVELGAVLADRLPRLNLAEEYMLDVGLNESDAGKRLCFSNQIVRLRYADSDGEMVTGTVPLRNLAAVHGGEKIPSTAHVEYLPTVATSQYDLPGEDPEEALSQGLEAAIDDFISRINRVVAAHLMLAPENAGILTPSYDRGTFPSMNLFVAGKEDRLEGGRLGLSAFRIKLVAPNLDGESAAQLRQLVSNGESLDDVAQVLRAARSYIEGGMLEFALLQLAIAAEMATTRFVHEEYEKRGVSRTKLDRLRTELKFSILLNIEVMALAPSDHKPDRDVLGAVDRVRDLRNKLMHYGIFESTVDELRELRGAVERHVKYLRSIATAG